jgi:hypothetical protein
VIALGAVLVVRGTGRRQARLDAVVRPALGSPAQVWTERGERVLGELRAEVAGTGFGWVESDAADVVEELRITAGQVAGLDQTLARVQTPRLRGLRDSLLARMAAAVRGLEHARAEVAALVIDSGVRSPVGDADERLAARVAGLRAGLAEVHRLAAPEDGQGVP